jgi:hypothetical protein
VKYRFEFVTNKRQRDNLPGFGENKFLNKLTVLNMNSTAMLDFEVTADAALATADCFTVVFAPSVTDTNVNASAQKSDIVVDWNIARGIT